MITEVGGQAIVEGETIRVNGIDVGLVAGNLEIDGTAEFADLLIGEEETVTFTYTIQDEDGGEATANVEATFCGALNTPDTIDARVLNGATIDLELRPFTPSNAINGFAITISNLDAPGAPDLSIQDLGGRSSKRPTASIARSRSPPPSPPRPR